METEVKNVHEDTDPGDEGVVLAPPYRDLRTGAMDALGLEKQREENSKLANETRLAGDLRHLMHSRLAVDVDPKHSRITVDDIRFRAKHDLGQVELFVQLPCIICGRLIDKLVYNLAQLGGYLELADELECDRHTHLNQPAPSPLERLGQALIDYLREQRHEN